jgi:hypothetical protein
MSAQRDPRIARLPKVPRALAERLGFDTGWLLIAKFGGKQLAIPTTFTRRNGTVLTRALGEKAARVMAELFAGSTLEIPTGARFRSQDRRKAIALHRGSHGEVAASIGCTRRYVRMVRAAAKPASPVPVSRSQSSP